MRDEVGLKATGMSWARVGLLLCRGRGSQRRRGGCHPVHRVLALGMQESLTLLATARQRSTSP